MRQLPSEYHLAFRLDLVRNKRQLRQVVCINLLILAAALIPALFARPLGATFGAQPVLKLAALSLGMMAYIPLHEAVHALFMKLFGCRKVRFGFKLMYAYAGCDEYFYKWPYLIIALAPVLLWGAVLWALAGLFSQWFWVIYGVQLLNLSGAAGDVYVTWRLLPMPASVLIRDTGTAMLVYTMNTEVF
ncbi:MAG: DUF3267 domain-containing protein [Clostridia bacterium]|nr:DUF3267 domain-containing protein [Clostridia bacterium]